ncbi:GAF domain-containing SpoIIE family protein phosphatase [Metabacillus endolithicus]|uniref:GAF domain-containing SpoIIE family protein phosphatase n=1 Tax=Metabacillus endolithicus TaxID=1535204 RepID=A0ABW5C0R5_9BACI|nr:GAF domain-containing SpoIIE family protein phosphatase [Metabacillus endolithicus]UPG65169.1 SpoIIE family protein phosphatase [Metabacillus endolithicus]
MSKLKKFEQAALNVMQLMSETITARSFFVATTRNNRFKILEKFNLEGGCPIPSHVDEPVEMSYCHIVANNRKPLLVKDAENKEPFKSMAVTDAFSIGSYAGVPIYMQDGSVFGTLCALDPIPNRLREEDISVLEMFASFISNTISLEEAYSKLKQYEEQITLELQLAKNIQTSFLSEVIDDEHIKVDFLYTPSSDLSGDLCRWGKVKNGVYTAIVLDVMGHGVSSAMIGMAITPILETIANDVNSPYEVMCELNRLIKEWFQNNSKVTTFITGIYLVIDTNNNVIKYYNAGHPAGMLVNHNGTSEILEEGGVPLGILDELPYVEASVTYQNPCEILLYSDGVLDHLIEKNDSKQLILALMDRYKEYVNNQVSIIPLLKDQVRRLNTLNDDICAVSISVK